MIDRKTKIAIMSNAFICCKCIFGSYYTLSLINGPLFPVWGSCRGRWFASDHRHRYYYGYYYKYIYALDLSKRQGHDENKIYSTICALPVTCNMAYFPESKWPSIDLWWCCDAVYMRKWWLSVNFFFSIVFSWIGMAACQMSMTRAESKQVRILLVDRISFHVS